MRTDNFGDYEISHDGRTTWINRGELLGRFSHTGIDVHVNGVCKEDSCVPGPTNIRDWNKFKILMMAAHHIKVDDKYMPNFLKDT